MYVSVAVSTGEGCLFLGPGGACLWVKGVGCLPMGPGGVYHIPPDTHLHPVNRMTDGQV